MSDRPPSRAAELAATQVESIVAAAQQAADQMTRDQRRELQEARRKLEDEAEGIREDARRDAERSLAESRQKATRLQEDARREAGELLAEARRDAAELRDQTRAAVAGRVAAAEKAAAEVLEEARALSNGLRQLGASLGDQAERILRDVTAAHRRMQADLRVVPEDRGPSEELESIRRRTEPSRRFEPATEGTPRVRRTTAAEPQPASARRRENPFDELEVPSWVGRER